MRKKDERTTDGRGSTIAGSQGAGQLGISPVSRLIGVEDFGRPDFFLNLPFASLMLFSSTLAKG